MTDTKSNEPEKVQITDYTGGKRGDVTNDRNREAAATTGDNGGGGTNPSGQPIKPMNIKQLDQGIGNIKEYSDRIKKKEANLDDLERLQEKLQIKIIDENGLADSRSTLLKEYIYNDLCNGVIQELTNTYQLPNHRDYKNLVHGSEEKKKKEAKYVEKVIILLKFFMDLMLHELKNNRFNENLLRACSWLFDPRTQLHKTFHQLTKEHLDRYRTKIEGWRRVLKPGDLVDVRVKIDLWKDDSDNSNTGWIQGRITNVSACQADIDLISQVTKSQILDAFKKQNTKTTEDEIEIIKMVCERSYDQSEKVKFTEKQRELIEKTEGLANELTLVFPELPSWRDQLIDRWSFDLAEFESQTKKEYSWKRKYENKQMNNDDYDSEEEKDIPEEAKTEDERKQKDAAEKAKRRALRHKLSKEVKIKEKEFWQDGTIVDIYTQIEEPMIVAPKEEEENKTDDAPNQKEKKQRRERQNIRQENPKRPITYVRVGFRIYCQGDQNSNKKDENDDYFYGFGQRNDHHIPLFDPRIKEADANRIKSYRKRKAQEQEQAGDSEEANGEDNEAEDDERRWAENRLLDETVPYAESGVKEKTYCFPREKVSLSTKFIEMINYFGNMGGFKLIQDVLSKRAQKIKSKSEVEVEQEMSEIEQSQEYVSPSLASVCQLTMMVSMPFQLLHYDFIMGTDGEEEEEPEEDPSSHPSKKTLDYARSYWKIDGNRLHDSKYDSKQEEGPEDVDEDSFMFFNLSAVPSQKAYLNAECQLKTEGHSEEEKQKAAEYNKRVFGRTYAGYGLVYTVYVQQQLLSADQASLKALQTSELGQMQSSLTQVFYAIEDRHDADMKSQKLKLDICNRCLSTKDIPLDLKIWCVTELSELIKLRIQQIDQNQGSHDQKQMADMRKKQLQSLVNEMKNCRVFDLIWTVNSTTDQLVMASAEMFKNLAMQRILELELLQKFWSLTADQDLKVEVFKILQKTSNLEEQHLNFIVEEISKISRNSKDAGEQLSELELRLLAENGSFRHSEKQKPKIVDLFWSILKSSDKYSRKLVDEAITCFVRFGKSFFSSFECLNLLKLFVKELEEDSGRTPTASYIQFFCQLFKTIQNSQKIKRPTVKDKLHVQESRFKEKQDTFNENIGKAGKKSIDQLQETFSKDTKDHKQNVDAFTLKEIVQYVVQHLDLKRLVMRNLDYYKTNSIEAYKQLQDQQNYKYKETCLLPNYSQFEQVTLRAAFITELSKVTKTKINKVNLQSVFDVCKKSFDGTQIDDMEVFFRWCSSATEEIKLKNVEWQENRESYMSENYVPLESKDCISFIELKVASQDMKLDNLPLEGYEFIADQFKKLNKDNILEHAKPRKPGKKRRLKGVRPKQSDDSLYKIWVDPGQLLNIDIIKQIAFQSQEPDVVKKSIGLFVNCYLTICDDDDTLRCAREVDDRIKRMQRQSNQTTRQDERRLFQEEIKKLQIQKQNPKQALDQVSRQRFVEKIIAKIFTEIDKILIENDQTQKTERMIEILEQIIVISEKKGMRVKPHKAVLKGDMLQQIKVKYSVADVQDHTRKTENRHVIVEPRSTTTVWEFVDQVSRMLGLGYKHIRMTITDKQNKKTTLRDYHYGKTLDEMGLQAMSTVDAERMPVFETVQQEELCTYVQKTVQQGSSYKNKKQEMVPDKLTAKCEAVVVYLFNLIKNPVTGKIEKDGGLEFLRRSLNKQVQVSDDDFNQLITGQRRRDIIRKGNSVDLEGFKKYILSRCSYDREDGSEKNVDIFKQFKYYGIKKNLEFFSDEEITKTEPEKMPRYIISNQSYVPDGQLSRFKKLFALLERQEFSEENKVWQLIKMLATNKDVHKEMIPKGNEASAAFWEQTFEDPNEYMKMYKQDIVYDLMEKEPIDEIRKVKWVAGYDGCYEKVQDLGQNQGKKLKCIETSVQDKNLWTEKFLAHPDGFDKIKRQFFQLNFKLFTQEELQKKLKTTAFWSTLIQNNFSEKRPKLNDADLRKLTRHSLDLLHRTLQKQINNRTIDNTFNSDADGKIIIENALKTFTKAVKEKIELFNEFKTHKEEGFDGKDIDLIKYGCFNEELRVRIAFRKSLIQIPLQFNDDARKLEDALNFFIQQLDEDFFRKENPTSSFTHEYFELFTDIVEEKRKLILQQGGELYEDLERLLENVRIMVKRQQENKSSLKAAETAEEEIKALNAAEENEILCVDLIAFTKKLVNSSGQLGKDLVNKLGLVRSYFEEYLFASHYSQSQAVGANEDAVNHSDVIEQSGSRAGDKNKSTFTSVKSKKAAFDLLIEFMGDDREVLQKFITDNMYDLVTSKMPTPDNWGQQPFKQNLRYQKFVGLKNMGATCYMNSILQQIFMIPSLRYNFIGIERDNTWEKFDEMTTQNIKDEYSNEEEKESLEELKKDNGITGDNGAATGGNLINQLHKERLITDVRGALTIDNSFYQLQRLMCNLECSEQSVFDTEAMCHTLWETHENGDKERTNMTQQKDSNEFLTEFSDTIAEKLKYSSRKFLINDTFEFEKCTQLICPSCKKVKNKFSMFKSLTLGIKNVSSVEEAITRDVADELIDDYRCSSCNERVRMKKRELLASSPNILIVHLNRIGYNAAEGRAEKINTMVKFQTELDLKPYSFHDVIKNRKDDEVEYEQKDEQQILEDKEKYEELKTAEEKENFKETMQPLDEDCWLYKLVGINVHYGSANSGHYWSYINTNRSGDRIDGNWNQAENWMEFNDQQVLDWDFKKQVETRCFGNDKASSNTGTSAYMLFYERVKKKDIRLVLSAKICKNRSGYNENELRAVLKKRTIHELKLLEEEKEDYYKRADKEDRIQEQERQNNVQGSETDQENTRRLEKEKKQADEKRRDEDQKVDREYEQRKKQIEERQKIYQVKLLEAGDMKTYKYIKIPFAYQIEESQQLLTDEEYKQNPNQISKLFFKQNAAYRQVIDENKKQNFKVDAYSDEFLNFVPQLFGKIAGAKSSQNDALNKKWHRALQQALEIGRKVAFEVMAKIRTNKWIGQVSQKMYKIIKGQNTNYKNSAANRDDVDTRNIDLAAYFIHDVRSKRPALKGILVECPDYNAQKQVCTLLSYALCHLKTEEPENKVINEARNAEPQHPQQMGQCYQFVQMMIQMVQQGGNQLQHSDKKKQLECFFKLFYDVMVHHEDTVVKEFTQNVIDPEQEEEKKQQAAQQLINTGGPRPFYRSAHDQAREEDINKFVYKRDTPEAKKAFRAGIRMYDAHIYENENMILWLCMAIHKHWTNNKNNKSRNLLGYIGFKLNLTYLQRTVCLMINEATKAVNDEIPDDEKITGLMNYDNLPENQKKYKIELVKSSILEKMLKPDKGEIEDFVPTLHFLSRNNEKVTRKVGRNYLDLIFKMNTLDLSEDATEISKKIDFRLDNLEKFIKIDDTIKRERIEWVLGFPEVSSFFNRSVEVVEYGTYKLGGKKGPYCERPYYTFKSSCSGFAYLSMINHYCTSPPGKSRRNNEIVADGRDNKYLLGAKLLAKLLKLMKEEEIIRNYVRSKPHPSIRFPTFMHSYQPTVDEMIEEVSRRMTHPLRKVNINQENPQHLQQNWEENWQNTLDLCLAIKQKLSHRDYKESVSYDDGNAGKQKHRECLEKMVQKIIAEKDDNNIDDNRAGNARPYVKNIPENFLHMHEGPYPYIIGGKSKEETDSQVQDNNKCLLKLHLQKIDTYWMYSMPFGYHNAALPEMKYKLPNMPNNKDCKLSYFDALDKLWEDSKDNSDQMKQDLKVQCQAIFTSSEYFKNKWKKKREEEEKKESDVKIEENKELIVKRYEPSKDEREQRRIKGRGGRGGGYRGNVSAFSDLTMNMRVMLFDEDGDDDFDGMQPRDFIHEIEGEKRTPNNEVCQALYVEAPARTDKTLKAIITLKQEYNKPENRARLNFEFPITPVLHYPRPHGQNSVKSFIMLITKKDPKLPYWYKDADNKIVGAEKLFQIECKQRDNEPEWFRKGQMQTHEDSEDSEEEMERRFRMERKMMMRMGFFQ